MLHNGTFLNGTGTLHNGTLQNGTGTLKTVQRYKMVYLQNGTGT